MQFQLADEHLQAFTDELIVGQYLVVDEAGRVLVWTGAPGATAPAVAAPAGLPTSAPRTYTPPYLAEKILTSRSTLEGERKQVTVLFADLKDSMALLAERDPEEARQSLDPVLERSRLACFAPSVGAPAEQNNRQSTPSQLAETVALNQCIIACVLPCRLSDTEPFPVAMVISFSPRISGCCPKENNILA